jgi:hypothetical protein
MILKNLGIHYKRINKNLNKNNIKEGINFQLKSKDTARIAH